MERNFTTEQTKIYRALKGLSACRSHFVTNLDLSSTKIINLFRVDNHQAKQTTLNKFERVGL